MALWGICTSTSEVLQRRSGVRQSYDTARIVCCRGSSDIRRAERVKRGEEEEEGLYLQLETRANPRQ
jgi:hypothetical protein